MCRYVNIWYVALHVSNQSMYLLLKANLRYNMEINVTTGKV